MKAFFLSISFMLGAGCSHFMERDSRSEEIEVKRLASSSNKEVSSQLSHLGQVYLETIGEKGVVQISERSKTYIKDLIHNIVSNNELLFERSIDPLIYIIKDDMPFHFSLPGGKYFFSSGLIRKYLTNEDLLAAVIAIEIIRCEKSLYERVAVVPTGVMTTERILSLTRIPIELRGEVNKWTYLVTRRAGYDPGALLNLIQIKNKNALDFATSVGNISNISREEFSYKNFLSKSNIEQGQDVYERNSSRGFYSLRADVLKE